MILNKFISVCLILASSWLCVIYGIGWFKALEAPLAIEYEGPCLWAAYNLSLGNNIYPLENLTHEPFIAVIYAPVYFILATPFQKLFGMNLWSLRAISMASFIFTVYFLWKLFQRSSGSKLAASLGALSFASYVSIWSWSLKARVDMVSLAFSAWALDSFHAKSSKERASIKDALKDYAPSIIAAVLATFSKQPSIIIPICLTLFLLFKRRFKDAIAYGGGFLLLSLIFFAIIQSMTQGGFSAQIQFASHFPFTVFDMLKHLNWIIFEWPKMIFALIVLLPLLIIKKQRSEALIPSILFLVSGAITVYTLGTKYPNANHAFLFFVFCSWLTALICTRAAWLGFIVIPICLLSTYIANSMLEPLETNIKKMPESTALLNDLKPSLAGKLILVEDPVIAMKLDAKPYFVDIATFFQVLHRNNSKMMATDLIANATARKFAAIVINKKDADMLESDPYFWPPEAVRLLRQHYYKRAEIVANGEIHVLYLPKF